MLEDIVLEAAHMSSLANNMLDLARLDAGQEHIEEDVVDLSELARQIARRALNLASAADVSIRADVGEPVLVVGRPDVDRAGGPDPPGQRPQVQRSAR